MLLHCILVAVVAFGCTSQVHGAAAKNKAILAQPDYDLYHTMYVLVLNLLYLVCVASLR